MGDFDLVEGAVWLRERKRDRSRHTLRRVPILPVLADVLTPRFTKHPSGWVFCNSEGSPATVPASNHQWQMAVVGSPWTKPRGEHVPRHSFASNCAAARVDQRLIDVWMGQQNAATAARYRHLIPTNEAVAMSRVFTSEAAAVGITADSDHGG